MFDVLTRWLADNEAILSATTALIALIGVAYAVMVFVFSTIRRGTGKLGGVERGSRQPAAQGATAGTGNSAATPRLPIHEDHVSLAVLRFEPLSIAEDDQYIASGISSEVIALVTPVPDIRVSSRMASFGWDTGATGIAAAGEQLNADFVLSGSLQRAGSRVRVIARLTEISRHSEVWTHTYDRQLEDLFEVQHDIAQSIVGAVLGEMKLAEILLANRVPDHQLDAWGLVQKAYYFWLTNFSVEGILRACDYLRRALEIDPDYAAARAALAMLLAQQMTARICPDYQAVVREAAEMIEAAYRLAPNDIDVLENAGVVWQNLGDSDRAIRALRHGISLAPLNLISRGYLALALAFTRGQEGAREAEQLLAENHAIAPKHPSTPYWHFFHAVAAQALGHYEESIDLCQKSLLGQPGWIHTYYFLANGYCMVNDIDAARRSLATAAQINPMLTPRLHLENVERITGNGGYSAAFVGGLVRNDLVEGESVPGSAITAQ